MSRYPAFLRAATLIPHNHLRSSPKFVSKLYTMPRVQTDKAIIKSQRDAEQKSDAHKKSVFWASKRYRLRNHIKYNQKAAARAREKKPKLSEAAKDLQKEKRKAAAKKYYLNNRTKILSKAEDKRWKAHVEKHDGADWAWFTYKSRKYNLRTGVSEDN